MQLVQLAIAMLRPQAPTSTFIDLSNPKTFPFALALSSLQNMAVPL